MIFSFNPKPATDSDSLIQRECFDQMVNNGKVALEIGTNKLLISTKLSGEKRFTLKCLTRRLIEFKSDC